MTFIYRSGKSTVRAMDQPGKAGPYTSIPESWVGMALVIRAFFKGLPSFLFPPKAGLKAAGSSTIPNALGLSLTIISQQLLSLIRKGIRWGGPTQVGRCGNDLQAWFGGL